MRASSRFIHSFVPRIIASRQGQDVTARVIEPCSSPLQAIRMTTTPSYPSFQCGIKHIILCHTCRLVHGQIPLEGYLTGGLWKWAPDVEEERRSNETAQHGVKRRMLTASCNQPGEVSLNRAFVAVASNLLSKHIQELVIRKPQPAPRSRLIEAG